MDLQIFINKAQELKRKGNLQEALACYNDAFDLLVKEADEWAKKLKSYYIIGNN